MESGSVPACAVVTSAVFVNPCSPPLYTNKYLPPALYSPCLLGHLLPCSQEEPVSLSPSQCHVCSSGAWWGSCMTRGTSFCHRQEGHATPWGP